MSGSVYLIHSLDRFKIGVTLRPDPEARLSEVAPQGGAIVHLVASAQPYAIEAALHCRFAHCSLGGEWFALSPDEVDVIRALRGPVDDVSELPHSLRPPADGADQTLLRLCVSFERHFLRQLEYVAGGLGVSVEQLVTIVVRGHLSEYRALADEVLCVNQRAG